jgi:hypothetical protein
MFTRKVGRRWVVWVAVMALGGLVWARAFPLTQSKEQLGLNYDFSATAKDGSVRLTLTIKDLGKLKPLRYVLLSIPSDKKDDPRPEVFVPLATQQDGGNLTAWAQLSREMAERATVELAPENAPDGGKVLGGVFYRIAVREHIKDVP